MAKPPGDLVELLHTTLRELLTTNPMAPSSEAYMQNHVEFAVLSSGLGYYLRIGINYHGDRVQHVRLDGRGKLLGWNPRGDPLGTGASAQLLLSGHTIFDRDPGEQLMSDSKFAGGRLPSGQYVRTEFKARGWLGKTRNLDGKQLEKDIDLLKDDRADLLVIVLSEVAYRKWRGEGPEHHAARRTGTGRFVTLFPQIETLSVGTPREVGVRFEGQHWTVSHEVIRASPASAMPGAVHVVTNIWRS